MRRFFIAFFLLLASITVNAADFGLHLGSVHIPGAGMNNFNPGAYIITDDGWTLGTYFNSERHQSVYTGRTFNYKINRDWSAQLAIGIITGYEAHDVLPLVAPSITRRIPDSDWKARLFYLPKVEKKGSHVLHLTVQRPVNWLQ